MLSIIYCGIFFFVELINVSARSSYRIVPKETKITGVFGKSVELEWSLPPVTGYQIISTTVYLNVPLREFIIAEGVSDANIKPYGRKIFRERLHARIRDNVYTVFITNVQYNDTHKFILKAGFQKIGQSSGAFLESIIEVVEVLEPERQNRTLTIGIGVGLAFLLIATLILIVYCFKKRKQVSNRKRKSDADGCTTIKLNDINDNEDKDNEEDGSM